jgi:hypothetical protein
LGRRAGLIVAGAAATAVAVLGWGWWHAHTHASVHVAINDVALKTAQQRWAELKSGEIVLRDAAGRALAHGRIAGPYGIVEFTDAAAGGCGRFERQAPYDAAARGGWQTCFEGLSRWQAEWARRVATASVATGTCKIDAVPVDAGRSEDWWLWWVPLPHVGGKPYTTYSFALFIDSAKCSAVSSAP